MRQFLRLALAVLALVAIVAAAWTVLYLRPVAVQVAAVERDVPVLVFGLGTVEARKCVHQLWRMAAKKR